MVKRKFLNRLIFIGLFLVGFVLIFIAVRNYFSKEKTHIAEQKKEELKSIAKLKIDQISTWYSEEVSDAQLIANENFMVDLTGEWVRNPNITVEKELLSELSRIKLEHGYTSVTIYSVDLKKKLSSDSRSEKKDSLLFPIIQNCINSKKAISSDIYRSPVDRKIYIDFIAPVISASNIPSAICIFRQDPGKFIYPLIQSWPILSRTSETLIIRKEDDSVLFLNNLRHVDDAALNLTIPITEKNVPAVYAAMGNTGFIDGYDYRKKRVLAYTDSIPGTNWFLISKIDHEELFNGILFSAGVPVLFSIILILILLFLFYFFYINQQKNSYKKLYQSNQEFRTTLYSIGDAVITTDKLGRVKYLNPVAEKLTGWLESEACKQSIEEVFVIINEDNHEPVVSPVKMVLEKGLIVGLANHTLLISKHGDETPIADSGAPIFDENGEISGVVLVFRDQTNERRHLNEIIETQRELATLLSNLPGMAYRCKNDADWTMEFVSRGCEILTGYFSSELENNNVISYGDIIHTDDRQRVWDSVQTDINKHSFFQLEYRIITKNGYTKWVWEKGHRIFNLKNDIIAFEGFIIDITDRKKAENALLSSEHLFQTLAENATVGIFRTDSEGMTIYVNPTWCELVGIEAQQALKDGWLESVHPDDREALLGGWGKAFSTKSTSIAEYRFIHPDGKIVYVKGQAVPEFNDQGEFLGYIGTLSNITESIMASETLLDANKLLRIFIDNIPDAVYMKDIEGRKMIANKADVENCGFHSEEELIGKHDFDMFPKEIAAKFWEDDKKVLQTGIPVLQREEKLVNLKNKTKWLITSKIPFKDKNGKIIGLIGIGNDITIRKRNEDEMLKLTKAITQSPVSIVITNLAGDIEYINPKFSEVTGYSYEEVIGKNPRILNSGSQPKEFYAEMWSTILAGNDWKAEFHNKKKNGELFWENVIISPILNDEKEIIYFVAVKEDITEKKKMVEELISAKERAEESDRLKSSFLANMSHEIRTPLNSILGFSNFLTNEDDLTNQEKKEFSNIINKSAEGLLQIINDIIDISSLETGQLKTFYTHLNVNSILKSIHTVFSLKLVEINKSHLFLILLEKEDITVYADENRFIQIVTNLLSNAIKFTSRGEISFGVENIDDDKVTFIVTDSGIGIKPEMQVSIFERFRQAEEDTTRNFGGNGLGLSIVKNLVELMGGEIWLESEIDKGSKFRFWLPRVANNK